MTRFLGGEPDRVLVGQDEEEAIALVAPIMIMCEITAHGPQGSTGLLEIQDANGTIIQVLDPFDRSDLDYIGRVMESIL